MAKPMLLEGVCCHYCAHHEDGLCPVADASPWSRWSSWCYAYEPNAAISAARTIEQAMRGVSATKDAAAFAASAPTPAPALRPYEPGDFARAYPPHYACINLLDAGVGECCESCRHYQGPEKDCGHRNLTADEDGAYVWVRCTCYASKED